MLGLGFKITIKLENGDFIKLTPNPFINFVIFDFVVKGHQRLNVDVFSAATGTKVATRTVLTVAHQFKMDKL
jgi:hypothetical protein